MTMINTTGVLSNTGGALRPDSTCMCAPVHWGRRAVRAGFSRAKVHRLGLEEWE